MSDPPLLIILVFGAVTLNSVRETMDKVVSAQGCTSCLPVSEQEIDISFYVYFSVIKVREYELRRENFSLNGNFGFGIQEHIDLGIKYDPSIGIYGMDFYVVLGRAGTNVRHRRRKTGRVGNAQMLHKEDAMKWFQQKYDGIILNAKKQ
jgi:hypothetical protein